VARNETEMPDALVCADVVRDLRHAMAAQVFLTGAYDAAHAADRNRHHCGIAQVGNSDRHIHAFIDEIDDAIDEQHVRADLWVALQEFAYDRAEIAPPESHRCSHRKLADRLRPARAKNVLCLLRGGEDIAAALQILRAFVSEVDTPRGALEERNS